MVLVVAVLVFGYFFIKDYLRKSGKADELHIVEVERGMIRQTLSATGTITAAAERIINASVSSEIENVMRTSGEAVSKGDLILKLDKEFTKLEYERLEDQLALRKNNISKLKLEFDKNLVDLGYQNEIKALEVSELRTQLQDQKRLEEIGGATKEEVEGADLKLKIATIQKKQLENELAFKQNVNATDKNNLQLEYNIQAKRLTELQRILRETDVRSPQTGVITWINENIGKRVTVGEPLVRIANLDRFEVEALTSDQNAKQIQLGLPVEIRIGNERLMGSISRILPEIVNNTVRFYVALEDPGHKLLRPNLRTECYIIKANKSDVLRAKRGAALKGNKTQFVYKIVGNEAVKVQITKGLTSSDYFEIIGGLSEGDKIIMSDTEDFDHMNQFTIKE